MKQQEKGIIHIGIALGVILVLAAIAFGGWWVWDKNNGQTNSSTTQEDVTIEGQQSVDETANWISVTTQSGAFSMKIPDGWKLTNYLDDFLGALGTTYVPGTRAIVETSNTEYAGHSLRFRASVISIDDAGSGPQWASPQPGLEESNENFSIGSLHGKRYKGVFQNLNQTIYEYVFILGDNEKLDIVYTIYDDKAEKDEVATVEKAIRTIKLENIIN